MHAKTVHFLLIRLHHKSLLTQDYVSERCPLEACSISFASKVPVSAFIRIS